MASLSYLFAFCLLASAAAGPTPKTFKLCVPHKAYDACMQMVEQGKTVGVAMTCVSARDRVDCMTKMKAEEADFEAADPEDMYIAAKRFGDSFSVFKEIRTKEEPNAEFRYEAVVVIHKDVDIKRIEDLKGLKSCHTGVGRNVGYKIPITKLSQMGILPPLNYTELSPRENELKSLSTFFSKSCIVGKWSPDQEITKRLKKQYSNLCQMCEFPDKCDYPDQNSGYEGALRCLAVGGGDVAFTKVIFVKKFFGMAYGTQPAAEKPYKPEDYAYLCPDATKRPVVGEPCIWAARPWQGYMTSDKGADAVAELREDIAKLNDLGVSTHADWISSVLALNNLTLTRDNNGPYSPQQYLVKAKYDDVIERDVLRPTRMIRLGTTTDLERSKCEDLAIAAYARDIRPGITCNTKDHLDEETPDKDGMIDISSAEPGLVFNVMKNGVVLQPVLKEEYDGDHRTTAVAVVKKSSAIQSLADLKGHKACFAPIPDAAGYIIPLHVLLSQDLIVKNSCPYAKSLDEFFSIVDHSADTFECLTTKEGEVAFMDYDTAMRHVDGGEFAGESKSADFELLCKDGSRKPFDQHASCNLGKVPPRVVVADKKITPVEKDDILFTMLNAADKFHKNPEYFEMFGSYKGHANVLFSNAAIGFETVHDVNEEFGDYLKMQEELKTCMFI